MGDRTYGGAAMAKPVLLAQLPLDVGLIVQQDALGAQVPVRTEIGSGHFLLPSWSGDFDSQPSAPLGLESPNQSWGVWTSRLRNEGIGQAEIDCVGMRIE